MSMTEKPPSGKTTDWGALEKMSSNELSACPTRFMTKSPHLLSAGISVHRAGGNTGASMHIISRSRRGSLRLNSRLANVLRLVLSLGLSGIMSTTHGGMEILPRSRLIISVPEIGFVAPIAILIIIVLRFPVVGFRVVSQPLFVELGSIRRAVVLIRGVDPWN
jgi:hypothetical protein